ncbi:C-type lectin domain family 12 member B-like [Polypterus senegalus]|uniref:C-type lectin domain family 12 member B-like n=1 Tax=Polypterus senegalus TaxID=55291 RepID=UPI0019667D4A|nr:C-type lectin domain family 12 member B-like [Polypterus senegalus]
MACRVHYLANEETCEIQRAEEHAAPVPPVRAERRVNLVKMLIIFSVLLVASLIFLSVYNFIKLNHKEQELQELRNAVYILNSYNTQLQESQDILQSQHVTLNEKLDELTKESSNLKEFYCDGTNTSPDNTCSLCKPGGISFNSKCYFISTDKLTWKESRDWCETSGGRLVNIETLEELDFLKSKAPSYHWIGGYDISKENTTTRMGAEPVKSKRASDDDKEECLMIDLQMIKVYNHRCGEPSRWICESAVFPLHI